MTAPIVVAGMTEADRDAHVLELAQEHRFDEAVELIEDWLEWDMVGRWNDFDAEGAEHPVNTAITEVRTNKARPTVKDRLVGEFGGITGDEDE